MEIILMSKYTSNEKWTYRGNSQVKSIQNNANSSWDTTYESDWYSFAFLHLLYFNSCKHSHFMLIISFAHQIKFMFSKTGSHLFRFTLLLTYMRCKWNILTNCPNKYKIWILVHKRIIEEIIIIIFCNGNLYFRIPSYLCFFYYFTPRKSIKLLECMGVTECERKR